MHATQKKTWVAIRFGVIKNPYMRLHNEQEEKQMAINTNMTNERINQAWINRKIHMLKLFSLRKNRIAVRGPMNGSGHLGK